MADKNTTVYPKSATSYKNSNTGSSKRRSFPMWLLILLIIAAVLLLVVIFMAVLFILGTFNQNNNLPFVNTCITYNGYSCNIYSYTNGNLHLGLQLNSVDSYSKLEIALLNATQIQELNTNKSYFNSLPIAQYNNVLPGSLINVGMQVNNAPTTPGTIIHRAIWEAFQFTPSGPTNYAYIGNITAKEN